MIIIRVICNNFEYIRCFHLTFPQQIALDRYGLANVRFLCLKVCLKKSLNKILKIYHTLKQRLMPNQFFRVTNNHYIGKQSIQSSTSDDQ